MSIYTCKYPAKRFERRYIYAGEHKHSLSIGFIAIHIKAFHFHSKTVNDKYIQEMVTMQAESKNNTAWKSKKILDVHRVELRILNNTGWTRKKSTFTRNR